MIDAREDLRDSRGVGDHAARTHDLGQVTTGYNGWRLVVDAALEASWAPVHELNGTLGLDRGNGRIHILWHYISLPNTGCRLLPTNMYVIYLHPQVPAVKWATTGMTEPNGSRIIIQNVSSTKLSQNEHFPSCNFLPSSRGTSCSRPCTCRGEDHTSPSWRLARRQTWWSLPRTAAHGMPSLQRWLVHRRSTWSGCVGMAPSWFGTLASESNHPIIQSSNHPIQTQNNMQNMSQKTPNKSTKIRGDKATKLYEKFY